jgi:hypothetical protein
MSRAWGIMPKVGRPYSYLGAKRWLSRARERARPRSQDQTASLFPKIKDYAGFGFSIIAVAISLFTFYFGTIRQVDEVRLIINSFPIASLDSANIIHVAAEADFILVNGGTRDAAILEIGYKIAPLEDFRDNELGCDSNIFLRSDLLPFAYEPFVLKKSEIRPIHINAFADKNKEKLFNEPFASHENDYVALCMYFRIATPSRKEFRTLSYVQLAGVLIGTESRNYEDGTDYAISVEQNHILIHSSETIFATFGKRE